MVARKMAERDVPVAIAQRWPFGASTVSASVAIAAAAGTMAWAQAQPVPGGVYTCIDAKGRKLTADRPIVECIDREQKVLNPSGTVRAKVGPSLTAQEKLELENQ